MIIVAAVLVTVMDGPVHAQQLSEPDPGWRIAQIRNRVYRVDAGDQVTLFVATGDGIVLVDPLNSTVSVWLRSQLANQFPNQPVRYVAYTSHRFNRVSGGSVFEKSATIVGHDAFDAARERESATLSGEFSAIDVNRDGRLQRDELTATTQTAALVAYDRNDDGVVTARELYSSVSSPGRTFSGRHSITLGDQTVELIHVLAPSAVDGVVVYFPRERLLFAPNLLPLGSLPRSIGPSPLGTIASLRTIEALDFDVLLTESGAVGSKADVTAFREYLEALTHQVREGFNAGRSLTEVQQDVNLVQYAALGGYGSLRNANVAEAYQLLRPVLTTVFGAPYINLQRQTAGACDRRFYDTCTISSRLPSVGGLVGLNVAIGRLTLSGEIGSAQTQTARLLETDDFFPPYEFVFQHRAVVASFLLGYEVGRGSETSITLVGGPSFVFANNGVTVLSTNSSLYFSAERTNGMGVVVGANIVKPISRTMSVVIPLRLTKANRGISNGLGGPTLGSVSIAAGAGLQFVVSRSSR